MLVSRLKTEAVLFNSYLANIFVLKMLSYNGCCIYSNALQNTFTMEANTLIWIHSVCIICYQSTEADEREQRTVFVNGGKRVNYTQHIFV